MKTIYKYPLQVLDSQTVQMPENSEILSVGECPRDGLVMWAQVDIQEKEALQTIILRGTGQPLNGSEGYFVGTVQMRSGLVWHVFSQ